MQPANRQRAQDHGAQIGLLVGSAGHLHPERARDGHPRLCLALQPLDQRTQAQIDEDHHPRQQQRIGPCARPRHHAHRRRTPQRRRRVQAVDVESVAEDDARAQKTDARHDLRRHAGWAHLIREQAREHHKGRRPQRHQRIRPQPRHALAHLPFGSDHRAAGHGHAKVHRGHLQIMGEKGGQHRGLRKEWPRSSLPGGNVNVL